MLVVFGCLFLFGSCVSLVKPLNQHNHLYFMNIQNKYWTISNPLVGIEMCTEKKFLLLVKQKTMEGYHQIYIQSTPKMTLYEQQDNMMSSEAYSCEFIVLRMNEKRKGRIGMGLCLYKTVRLLSIKYS